MEFCYKTQSFGGNMPQVASQKPVKKKHPMLKLLKLKKNSKLKAKTQKVGTFGIQGAGKASKVWLTATAASFWESSKSVLLPAWL